MDITAPTEIVLRSATPGDGPFITGQTAALGAVSGLPWLPREATGQFAADGCHRAVAAISQPGHLVLIAAGGSGNPLGFLHATTEESVFTGEHVGYVSTVVVTASAQGAGIGRHLMLAAEQWARQQGCTLMTLEVFAENRSVRQAYTRLGYQEQTLKLAKPL